MTTEGDVAEVEVTEVVADEQVGNLSYEEALQQVLKKSLVHDGLARGLRECVKALDSKKGQLCILAESCDEKEYVRLIEALCAEYSINLIKIADSKNLGEMIGLCKIDREGNARKVVGCSCAVICDYGEDSIAKKILLESLNKE